MPSLRAIRTAFPKRFLHEFDKALGGYHLDFGSLFIAWSKWEMSKVMESFSNALKC